jgi:mono/diheme cytochrome c family protein
VLLAITTEGKIGLGVVAALFIVFALLASFWFPRRDPNFPGSRIGLFSLATLVLFVATVAAVVVFAKEEEGAHGAEAAETHGSETGEGETTGGGTEAEAGGEGDAASGEPIFSENCAACHTLEAAGASGNVGPNLDESQPDAELVEERVRNGVGAMPAFEGRLSDQEIADVTAFVVESTQS